MRASADKAQQEWFATENGLKKKAALVHWQGELYSLKRQLIEMTKSSTWYKARDTAADATRYRTEILLASAVGEAVDGSIIQRAELCEQKAKDAFADAIHYEARAKILQKRIDEFKATEPVMEPDNDGSAQYMSWRLYTNALTRANELLEMAVKEV